MGVTAAVVGVIGLGASAKGQRDERKASKKQNAIARRRESIEGQRNRVRAIRQQRSAQATAINAGANAGSLNSSSIQGAIGSVGSTTAANIGFANQLDQLGNRSLDAQSDMDGARRTQAIGNTIQSSTSLIRGF